MAENWTPQEITSALMRAIVERNEALNKVEGYEKVFEVMLNSVNMYMLDDQSEDCYKGIIRRLVGAAADAIGKEVPK